MGEVAAVAMVLLAGSDAPSLVPVDSPATPAALQFGAPPAAQIPQDTEDPRVKRFLAAAAGSFLGFGGVQALLLPLGSGGCRGICPRPELVALSTLGPIAAGLGAWAGYSLFGGEAGPLSPVLGVFPAGLFAFVAGVLMRDRLAPADVVPLVAGTGALLAGGMAFALDVRARQLEAAPSSPRSDTPNGRLVFTSLISASGSIVAVATSGILLSTCRCTVSAAIVGTLLFGAGSLTTWVVHRSLHGRGTPWIIAGGLLAGALMTGLLAAALLSPPSPAQSVVEVDALVLGLTLGVFAVPLALEWSHTETMGASHPTLAFGAAPSPSGGTVTAALRF